MNNLGYLFAAYAIIWLAFFAYGYRLGHRQEELRRRLRSLRQRQSTRALAGSAKASSRPRKATLA